MPPSRVSDPAEVAELKGAFDGMMSDLESANEREKTFLLNVSHELRTPLTAIRGYGEALVDGTTRKPAEAGAVVVRESQRLERLVQDLLDLARLEAGEFSVRPADVDLATVASDVRAALRPVRAARTASTLDRSGDRTVRPHRPGPRAPDAREPRRERAARVAAGRDRRDRGRARRDGRVGPGAGLEGADLAHAFDRFYLWSKYKGERPVGSGLGLADRRRARAPTGGRGRGTVEPSWEPLRDPVRRVARSRVSRRGLVSLGACGSSARRRRHRRHRRRRRDRPPAPTPTAAATPRRSPSASTTKR